MGCTRSLHRSYVPRTRSGDWCSACHTPQWPGGCCEKVLSALKAAPNASGRAEPQKIIRKEVGEPAVGATSLLPGAHLRHLHQDTFRPDHNHLSGPGNLLEKSCFGEVSL